MTTYKGTDTVQGGYYLNLAEWKLEAVDGAAGTLTGAADARYVRVPLLGLLVVGPLLGFAFVILLPFLGLAVIAEQGYRKATAALRVRRAAPARATTVAPQATTAAGTHPPTLPRR